MQIYKFIARLSKAGLSTNLLAIECQIVTWQITFWIIPQEPSRAFDPQTLSDSRLGYFKIFSNNLSQFGEKPTVLLEFKELRFKT